MRNSFTYEERRGEERERILYVKKEGVREHVRWFHSSDKKEKR